MIAFVEIRIRGGELGDGMIEPVARAEVRIDGNPVPGTSVRARYRPTTGDRIGGEAAWRDRLDVDRALPIPELADVEVASSTIFVLGMNPTQEDVACGLHEPLAFDYTPAVLGKRASPEERLEDGPPGLFDLQEQRVVLVAAYQ